MKKRKSTKHRAPGKGELAHYYDRTVRVGGEARGQRVMIEWIDAKGEIVRSAVKPGKLTPVQEQLF